MASEGFVGVLPHRNGWYTDSGVGTSMKTETITIRATPQAARLPLGFGGRPSQVGFARESATCGGSEIGRLLGGSHGRHEPRGRGGRPHSRNTGFDCPWDMKIGMYSTPECWSVRPSFRHRFPGRQCVKPLTWPAVIVASHLLEELAEVLSRPKFRSVISWPQTRRRFLAALVRRALVIETDQSFTNCRDLKDNKFWMWPYVAGHPFWSRATKICWFSIRFKRFQS